MRQGRDMDREGGWTMITQALLGGSKSQCSTAGKVTVVLNNLLIFLVTPRGLCRLQVQRNDKCFEH